ncbi:MAG: signal peptidase I [Bacilli bacterium]|nr:signal peptidase I [Bacilli bacterium]
MKGKNILKIVLNVIIWTIIIVATLLTIATLNSRGDGVPNILGYIPLNVQSESMEPEIMKGDLIVDKEYDEETMELKKGDVVSYIAEISNQRVLITHRIDHVISINQMVSYITKGDNNLKSDDNQVAKGDIVGIWKGFRIPFLGTISDFLQTKTGFISCVILPLALFFVYQLYEFIMLLFEYKEIK